jgi:hypothetical protein
MDFEDFEQLVLKVVFETDLPLTAGHLAYLGRISVRSAEKKLARLVEQGTLTVRTNAGGAVEYVFPSRKPVGALPGLQAEYPGPPSLTIGGLMGLHEVSLALRPRPSRAAAVALSMLIPGAGHIYAGKTGAGVAWMATTLMGYACCFLPGLFLHGLCLVSAAQTRGR